MIHVNKYSEIELAVIGGILNQPNYDKCKKAGLSLKPEYFYNDSHRMIFQAIQHLYHTEVNPDIVNVNNYLREMKKQFKFDTLIGSIEDVILRENCIPTSVYIEQHSKILVQNYISRIYYEMGRKLQNNAADPESVKSEYERKIREARLIIDDKNENTLTIGSELFEIYIDILDKKVPQIESIKTGFLDLDHYTNGLNQGDFWILASRAGIGKTTFGLNLAYNITKSGIPGLFISLEMPKIQLFRKIVAMDSGVSFQHILRNELTSDEMKYVCDSLSRLYKLPLYIADDTGEKINGILNYCLKLVNESGVRFVILDYLQLINGDLTYENRHTELSAVSRQIKSFALHQKIPVLGIAQLSRSIEQRTNKIPQLSDLKDSGSFEQDSDCVLFLSRLREFEKQSVDDAEKDLTKLYISKNRVGDEGLFKINFNVKEQRFTNYTPGELPF